jgi:primosomal protein N' (replication factor Y)
MFVQIAVPGPFPQGLTYLGIEGCGLGHRVIVPLRQREVVGIVTAIHEVSTLDASKLKKVLRVLDAQALFDSTMLALMAFVRDYYHVSAGDAFYTALPSLLAKGKDLFQASHKAKSLPAILVQPQTQVLLNAEQEQCVADIAGDLTEFSVHLLEGVTGSGKTEVYLELVQKVLDQGRSVLVLVPEIGLTPQTLKRFQARFGASVVAYHSGLTETAKRNVWRQALLGEVKLVIGTRSAVFLPLQNLGLLIIDEEHDTSYKQSVGVTYSAKSIAIKRAMQHNCAIVLGSATPSIEAIYFAAEKRYQHHILSLRARGHAMPEIKLIDMRQQPKTSGLSRPLLDAMRRHLEQKQQVLIFLNRRGYAPILMCHACGARQTCPDCEMSYTCLLYTSDAADDM